jgi:acyl-CoA synthetase (AMP-forming)/AMP-acid ligase II
VTVKGFNVMLGYFRQPGETAAAFTPEGYLRTGDIGVLDMTRATFGSSAEQGTTSYEADTRSTHARSRTTSAHIRR